MAALTRILEEPVLRKALIHTFVIKSSSTARTTSLGIETTLKQSETFWEFQNALGMTNAFYKTMKTLDILRPTWTKWMHIRVQNEDLKIYAK